MEKYVPLIKKYKNNLTRISFSLDGPTAAIHDDIRTEGSYEKVIERFDS